MRYERWVIDNSIAAIFAHRQSRQRSHIGPAAFGPLGSLDDTLVVEVLDRIDRIETVVPGVEKPHLGQRSHPFPVGSNTCLGDRLTCMFARPIDTSGDDHAGRQPLDVPFPWTFE